VTSLSELKGRSGKQQREVGRFLGESGVYSELCFAAMLNSPSKFNK